MCVCVCVCVCVWWIVACKERGVHVVGLAGPTRDAFLNIHVAETERV